MATGRFRLIAPAIALAALLPVGCAQPGPFQSRQASMGTLKASVSQLEFENQTLKKQVAELKTDNSRIENELAQEKDANGEITARLDDAKERLRRQNGGDATALGGSSRMSDDNLPPPASSRPRSSRTTSRPPPAVQLPRGENGVPFGSNDPEPFDAPLKLRDPGPQSRTDEDDDRWLPVARGMGSVVR